MFQILPQTRPMQLHPCTPQAKLYWGKLTFTPFSLAEWNPWSWNHRATLVPKWLFFTTNSHVENIHREFKSMLAYCLQNRCYISAIAVQDFGSPEDSRASLLTKPIPSSCTTWALRKGRECFPGPTKMLLGQQLPQC